METTELANLPLKSKIILNITNIFVVFMKSVETLGSNLPHAWRFYHQLFYRKMVLREIERAGLPPGSSVLHIGCGPLPLTAYELAKRRFAVHAVDCDPHAAAQAKHFLRIHSPEGNVKVMEADGKNMDFHETEGVWISLHVYPRDHVIQRVISSLKEGGVVVYRNPRGWLSLLYPRVDPGPYRKGYSIQRFRQFLGKETVVIKKLSKEDG